jgi:signal transduction histidine kinase
MNKLLDNLLNWAQLQMGTLKTKLQPVDLWLAISNAVELQNSIIEKKNITITQNINSKAKAKADQGMVDMILRNLISNAIKFTPAGGEVTISIEETANDVAVSVKDTGIGMSKSLQNKLFRINEKVSRPGTEGEQSTGLGLVLSFDMTQRMDGLLSVASEETKGSTFTLTLTKV